jgi:hypothetical protein
MNNGQRRRNERGQRVDVYMDAQAELFPEGSKGGIQAARLKELLAQANTLDLARDASAGMRRQGTEGHEGVRDALHRDVKTAWETYKTITLDHPDIKGLFESPSRIKNDQALVRFARAYADNAAPLTGLFEEYDLPATFFQEMRARADNFESHTARQSKGVGDGVDANTDLVETLRKMDEVVERLDTHVHNKYRDDPAKLAAWESARHLERAPHSKPKENTNAPPTKPANG